MCDLVEGANDCGRSHLARAWNTEVERQSREIGGCDPGHRQFVADQWNF
jgi:hypothetical protein